MPLLPRFMRTDGAGPGDDPGVGGPGNNYLYWIDRWNGATLRPGAQSAAQSPYGAIIAGYTRFNPLGGSTRAINNIGPAGTQKGWRYPFAGERTPNASALEFLYDANSAVQDALGDSGNNERFAIRVAHAPGKMDLTYRLVILSGDDGNEITDNEVARNTFQLTDFVHPVKLACSAYEASTYNRAALGSGASGIAMTRVPGTATGLLDSSDAATDTINVNIDIPNNHFEVASGAGIGFSVPAGNSLRALIYAPGVGWQWSTRYDNTGAAAATPNLTSSSDFSFPEDEDFTNYVVENQPALYIAFYNTATSLRVL